MCHTRNYCEFDEVFFQWKAFLQCKFFQQHKLQPCQESPPVLCLRDAISFSNPIPTWPLSLFGPSGPSPSPGGKGLFKEQREQRPSEELTLSLFWEIRHSRPSFILTRNYFKTQKSSLTKSFPNIQSKFSFF